MQASVVIRLYGYMDMDTTRKEIEGGGGGYYYYYYYYYYIIIISKLKWSMSTKHTAVFNDVDVLEPLFTIHDKYDFFFSRKSDHLQYCVNFYLTYTIFEDKDSIMQIIWKHKEQHKI